MLPFLNTLWRLTIEHRWQLLFLFFGIFLPFLLLGKLAEEIREADTQSWDEAGLHFIHQFSTPQRDAWIASITFIGGILTIPFVLFIAYGLRYLKRGRDAVFFLLAAVGSHCLNLLAKAFFERERPALWISPTPVSNYSFPSGHAMVSMAIALALVALAWDTKWRWPMVFGCGLSALLVGLSRMYLGVHYPTDIIGGWSAALLWVCGLWWIYEKSRATPVQVS